MGKVESALNMGPSFLVSHVDTLGNLGSTRPGVGQYMQVVRYLLELPPMPLLRTACPLFILDQHVHDGVAHEFDTHESIRQAGGINFLAGHCPNLQPGFTSGLHTHTHPPTLHDHGARSDGKWARERRAGTAQTRELTEGAPEVLGNVTQGAPGPRRSAPPPYPFDPGEIPVN